MNRSSYVERLLARATDRPYRVIIQDARGELSALEFRRLVTRLARALAEAGVFPGDRIAIVPTISADALAVRYAAGLLGCATVFCPNTGTRGRLAGLLARVHADAVVVFPETAGAVGEMMHSAGSPTLLSVGPVPGALDLLGMPAGRSGELVTCSVDPGALAVMVASGGTTGQPKLSRRTFAGWERLVDAGSMGGRRQLICTSFAYVAQVLADQVLLGGGTVILRDRFDAREILATIEADGITHLALVEPLLVELIDHPEFGMRDLSSLVAISHIGADAAPSLRRRLLGRAGPILAHPYGASETGIVSVLAGGDYSLAHPERLGTAGPPLSGVDVRIERVDGSEAPRGEEGFVTVRSPQVAEGYDGDAAHGGFRGDRYFTGDLGLLDLDGYLHVRGRAADQRQVCGRWVMPVDVQDALCDHPEVRYAVAVPADGGFCAVAVLAPGATVGGDDLRAFVAERRGEHLSPAQIIAVDRVPVTEQGKPNRARIAALLGEQREAVAAR
ncbi:MAG TPA: AMP-binding protein [Solirubrobacteraceae bacterium]|nr:AMP-binding protein [Solirubrobacteraceae bacterium]